MAPAFPWAGAGYPHNRGSDAGKAGYPASGRRDLAGGGQEGGTIRYILKGKRLSLDNKKIGIFKVGLFKVIGLKDVEVEFFKKGESVSTLKAERGFIEIKKKNEYLRKIGKMEEDKRKRW